MVLFKCVSGDAMCDLLSDCFSFDGDLHFWNHLFGCIVFNVIFHVYQFISLISELKSVTNSVYFNTLVALSGKNDVVDIMERWCTESKISNCTLVIRYVHIMLVFL